MPAKPPEPNAYQRLDDLEAVALARPSTGRATCRRGRGRGRTRGTRRTRRSRAGSSVPTRYAAASGRDVEHRREHAEEQQRRAEVLLVHEHEQRDAPREQQRSEVAQRREIVTCFYALAQFR